MNHINPIDKKIIKDIKKHYKDSKHINSGADGHIFQYDHNKIIKTIKNKAHIEPEGWSNEAYLLNIIKNNSLLLNTSLGHFTPNILKIEYLDKNNILIHRDNIENITDLIHEDHELENFFLHKLEKRMNTIMSSQIINKTKLNDLIKFSIDDFNSYDIDNPVLSNQDIERIIQMFYHFNQNNIYVIDLHLENIGRNKFNEIIFRDLGRFVISHDFITANEAQQLLEINTQKPSPNTQNVLTF